MFCWTYGAYSSVIHSISELHNVAFISRAQSFCLTLAMSYMTEILNSQSMKVSSGYEILSFSTYWKKKGTEGICVFVCGCLWTDIWSCLAISVLSSWYSCKVTSIQIWVNLRGNVHMPQAAYPEWPPLSVLKHSKHTLIKLHCAIKLCEVVIVDLQELQRKEKAGGT